MKKVLSCCPLLMLLLLLLCLFLFLFSSISPGNQLFMVTMTATYSRETVYSADRQTEEKEKSPSALPMYCSCVYGNLRNLID